MEIISVVLEDVDVFEGEMIDVDEQLQVYILYYKLAYASRNYDA